MKIALLDLPPFSDFVILDEEGEDELQSLLWRNGDDDDDAAQKIHFYVKASFANLFLMDAHKPDLPFPISFLFTQINL